MSEWPPRRLRAAGAALIVPNPFVSIGLFTDDVALVRHYRAYLVARRAAALAPVGLVARLSGIPALKAFALRGVRRNG